MNKKLLILSLFTALLAVSASAGVINFTTEEGYTDGTLLEQTVNSAAGSSITWNSASANVENAYQVDASNGWVQYSSPATGANNDGISHENFEPIFFDFDPANPDIVDCTVSLKWVQQGSAGNAVNLQFRILDPNGQRYGHIQIAGNGDVRGSGMSATLTNISKESEFTDITMRIDTLAQSLTFFVNGEAVEGAGGIDYLQNPNGHIGRWQIAQNFDGTTSPFEVRIGRLEITQVDGLSSDRTLD